MKQFFFSVLIVVLSVQTLWAGRAPIVSIAKDPYVSALVLNADTGEVLFEDNSDALLYPASVLKLMVLLINLERIEQGIMQLDDTVQVTVEAHRELHQGEELFKQGRLEEAKKTLESGMAKFQTMLSRYPELQIEDLTIEEALDSVLLWQYIHQLQQKQPPVNFPLKPLWIQHQDRVPILDQQFRRRLGIQ